LSKKTFVLGLGNILFKDEGIGVHAVEELEKYNLGENCELIDGGTAPLDCLPEPFKTNKLIIIDAVYGHKAPGTIYRFTPDDIAPELHSHALSLHQVGVLELLEIAKKTGPLAYDVVIIGIEPKEIELGIELTQCLRDKMPKIVDVILKEIQPVTAEV